MKLVAPFTSDQVKHLKAWQESGKVHPFTCCDGVVMDPSDTGMHCEKCGYWQSWVHDFMADGSALDHLSRSWPTQPKQEQTK